MKKAELKAFLDEKVAAYEHPSFLSDDPIQIPHSFSLREDVEVAAFLSATIAWGQRVTIINNARKLMDLMGSSPYDFVMNHKEEHLDRFSDWCHRTFQPEDLHYFLRALKELYSAKGSLEPYFARPQSSDLSGGIHSFHESFFAHQPPPRTRKHVSDPFKGSAAKRLNMFLRWMVRDGAKGVDFGLWTSISPSQLSCPLDVHSGNVARKLGLLRRKQNDWKAVQELDQSLRRLDPVDPVKYDFALFGLGVFEGF
ncbi:TIGR02757 family protein [Cryomorphaceae bacterium]|nr:TIGR02757 family protein [Cryomorphaceae bacterium]